MDVLNFMHEFIMVGYLNVIVKIIIMSPPYLARSRFIWNILFQNGKQIRYILVQSKMAKLIGSRLSKANKCSDDTVL